MSSDSGREDDEKLIFTREDGTPYRFYLMDLVTAEDEHRDLRKFLKPFSRKRIIRLTNKIERNGGVVVSDSPDDTDILVVNSGAVEIYTAYYEFNTQVDILWEGYIDRAIADREFELPRPERKGMGGQPGKHRRNEFTADEKEFLAQYLAIRVPDKNAGGRGGLQIYKDLERKGYQFNHGPYVLARNHTFWSWREKYERNQEEFDARIAEIIAENPEPKEGKGMYWRDRRASKGYAARHVRQEAIEPDEEEGQEGGIEHDGPVINNRDEDVRRRSKKRMASEVADERPPAKRARQSAGSMRLSRARPLHRVHSRGSHSSIPIDVDEIPGFEKAPRPGPSGTRHSESPAPVVSGVQFADPVSSVPKGDYNTPSKPRPKPRPKVARQSEPLNSQATLVNPSQSASQAGPSQGSKQPLHKEPARREPPSPGVGQHEVSGIQREERPPVPEEPALEPSQLHQRQRSEPEPRRERGRASSSHQVFDGVVMPQPPKAPHEPPFRNTRSRSRARAPPSPTARPRPSREHQSLPPIEALEEEDAEEAAPESISEEKDQLVDDGASAIEDAAPAVEEVVPAVEEVVPATPGASNDELLDDDDFEALGSLFESDENEDGSAHTIGPETLEVEQLLSARSRRPVRGLAVDSLDLEEEEEKEEGEDLSDAGIAALQSMNASP